MKKKKITSLQTLRLFASLGVLQYHLWQNYLDVTIKHPGTNFFLVLVGVVAALTQAKRIPQGDWRGYIRARYVRLYVTFIPLFLITVAAKWHEATWDWLLRSFFFIPIADRLPVIGATWMLSLFILFYFIFSLTFVARTEAILWPIFGIWAIGIIASAGFHWNPGLPSHWATLIFDERNLDFIMGYAAGVVLRKQWLDEGQGRWLFWLGLLSTIGGTVLLNMNFEGLGRSLFISLSVTLLILSLAVLEQTGATDLAIRLLSPAWLVWLGETSYVLYLSHGIFLQIWSKVLPVTPVLVPVITLGAIIAGAVGYVIWEKPLLAYFNRQRLKMESKVTAVNETQPVVP